MKYHHHKLKLTTLTPLHIGSGETLTSIGEYIVFGNKVKIIDQEFLYDLLRKKDLNDDYLDLIVNFGVNTNIYNFFKEHGIESGIKYIREINHNIENYNPESNKLLELFTKTDKRAYVPGSSLKGAVRSALFVYYIIKNKNLREKIENYILKSNDWRHVSESIGNTEHQLFNDEFTNVRFEDSGSAAESDIIVELSKRYHLYGENTEGLDNLKECIAAGKEIVTGLTVKPQIADSVISFINDENTKKLFEAINSVTNLNIDFEIELLQKAKDQIANKLIEFLQQLKEKIKQSDNSQAFIRLGKGKTYFYQTIAASVSKEAKNKLLDFMINNENTDKSVFPKTRVLTSDNEMYGWVKIETESTELYNSKTLPDNRITEPVLQGKKIEVVLSGSNKVDFRLNGREFKNIQLVRDKMLKNYGLPVEKPFTVVIWQYNNNNIYQVKLLEI